MTTINDFIDDATVTDKCKEIITFINKNTKTIDKIYNNIIDDIKVLYEGVSVDSNVITIPGNDEDLRDNIEECILHHMRQILLPGFELIFDFIFTVSIVDNSIVITKKR